MQLLSLSQLATKYGTDKGQAHHDYTDLYDKLLHTIQVSALNIVEIGIQSGASIRMWHDYFPNAVIHAIDLDINTILNFRDPPYGYHLIHGDETASHIWSKIPQRVDLVVDDGSHIPSNMIKSIVDNFHKLRVGGYWIMEDVHCNFHPNFSPTGDLLFPWISVLQERMQMIPNGIMTGNFKVERSKSEALLDPFTRIIRGIMVYKSLIIFERAEN